MNSENIKNWLIIGLLVLFLVTSVTAGTMIYLWYNKTVTPTTPNQWTQEPEIRIVEKIKRVEVPVEKIVVVEKKVIVEKLKLPDWIKNSADEQVLATAVIDSSDERTNAAAVINTSTGVGTIVTTPAEVSLFAFEKKKEVYVRAGYDTHLETQVSLGGKYRFFRFTGVHFGAYGEVSNRQNGEAVVGIEVSY